MRVRLGTRGETTRGGPRWGIGSNGRFRIASATKMFTAALIHQLADEHRLSLTAPVQRYLQQILPSSYPPVPVGNQGIQRIVSAAFLRCPRPERCRA